MSRLNIDKISGHNTPSFWSTANHWPIGKQFRVLWTAFLLVNWLSQIWLLWTYNCQRCEKRLDIWVDMVRSGTTNWPIGKQFRVPWTAFLLVNGWQWTKKKESPQWCVLSQIRLQCPPTGFSKSFKSLATGTKGHTSTILYLVLICIYFVLKQCWYLFYIFYDQ